MNHLADIADKPLTMDELRRKAALLNVPMWRLAEDIGSHQVASHSMKTSKNTD